MNRRELLIGAVAVASATALPALAAPMPSELIIYSDDLLAEAHRLGCKDRSWSYLKAVEHVTRKYRKQAHDNGQILHIRSNVRYHAPTPENAVYYLPMRSGYIADKISVIMPDGSYKVVKDRSRVI